MPHRSIVPPNLGPSDPKATPATSSVSALESAPEFAEQCRKAAVLAIHEHQEAVEAQLREEMAQLPTQFHTSPFHEHIQSKTPVSTIKAATERLLWHERLGHPSDHCLFNAHQHADGVTRFPHMDRVLDICPTCVRSKQTENAAGGNATGTAEQPHQGPSINFSFSGARSKNAFNRFPIGTKVKKKFGDKMFKGKVMWSPEDATEGDPNADDFGETAQSWRVECEDQEQEDCNEREMEQIAHGNPPRFDPHKHRNDDHIGLNGETSWILVTDHFSRMKHGDTRVSKASPINWLRNFLEKHAPACPGKCVFMDQGGKLHDNPKVHKLFTRFGCDIGPAGADASNQNAPVERSHLVVANAIRALLLGANLPTKFWPHAFHFWLRIDNSVASRDQLVSPDCITAGKKDDPSALRTFGCRAWVRPHGRRAAKLIPNSCKGIFLGFIPNADENVIWCDTETHVVKIAEHVRFDEGMNDLPPALVPPNVVHLQRAQNGEPLPAETEETSVDQFAFHLNPFSCTVVKGVQVTDDDPSCGLTLATDELNHRRQGEQRC